MVASHRVVVHDAEDDDGEDRHGQLDAGVADDVGGGDRVVHDPHHDLLPARVALVGLDPGADPELEGVQEADRAQEDEDRPEQELMVAGELRERENDLEFHCLFLGTGFSQAYRLPVRPNRRRLTCYLPLGKGCLVIITKHDSIAQKVGFVKVALACCFCVISVQ